MELEDDYFTKLEAEISEKDDNLQKKKAELQKMKDDVYKFRDDCEIDEAVLATLKDTLAAKKLLAKLGEKLFPILNVKTENDISDVVKAIEMLKKAQKAFGQKCLSSTVSTLAGSSPDSAKRPKTVDEEVRLTTPEKGHPDSAKRLKTSDDRVPFKTPVVHVRASKQSVFEAALAAAGIVEEVTLSEDSRSEKRGSEVKCLEERSSEKRRSERKEDAGVRDRVHGKSTTSFDIISSDEIRSSIPSKSRRQLFQK